MGTPSREGRRAATVREEAALHVCVLAFVALAYLIVKLWIRPSGGFMRYHLTDLLAGCALPSLVALFMRPRSPIVAAASPHRDFTPASPDGAPPS